MRARATLPLIAVAAALVLRTIPADAGCGCNKPPPPQASVRPAFASPGGTVTLFSSKFDVGKIYRATFEGGSGSVTVSATAVRKRDLADGQMKIQVAVAAPDLRTGPTRIRVYKTNGDRVLDIDKDDFTLLQAPLALAEGDGETVAKCYRAAVGKDGTVYFPVDISNIAEHMIFSGLGERFPLLFNASDVTIYNTQGFLMQLLGPAQAGIYAIDDPAGAPNSLQLTYDRHEFVTYRADHAHVGGLGLDPTDPAWHSDGTYHVDHDHLVIAIRGVVEGEGAPSPGSTRPFDLRVATALADGSNGVVTTRTIQWSDECTPPAAASSNGGTAGSPLP